MAPPPPSLSGPALLLLLAAASGAAAAFEVVRDEAAGCAWPPASALGDAQVTKSSAACRGKCVRTKGCTRYAWREAGGGTCTLSSGAADGDDLWAGAVPSDAPGARCGVTPDWSGRAWAPGCWFNQPLLAGSGPSATLATCRALCAATPNCTHVTFSREAGAGSCGLHGGPASRARGLVAPALSSCANALRVAAPPPAGGPRTLKFVNACPQPIWLSSTHNTDRMPLPGGVVKIAQGASYTYDIPSNGWAGRLWPKVGCDDAGTNCAFGDSVPPCPPGGCSPPAETKVEFNWPTDPNADCWYDVSLVDGFSLPMRITPANAPASHPTCTPTACDVSLAACPTDEADVGDLRAVVGGQVVACLSPCKKWNYDAPWGLHKSEQVEPGLWFCCPTPPTTPATCSANRIVNTKYVNLVRSACKTAYSYAYDDTAGLHACPGSMSFTVTLCP
ncbi:Glucan endo-1 [Scenedesmus sp. PABB004]|nr:Glucan endo-1 [Scenedesmus sp. PABB004]